MKALALAMLLVFSGATPVLSGDETCEPLAASQWAPAGVKGCTLDGPTAGKASWYPGSVAAANWCVFPWKGCQAVSITSLQTGIIITVQPAQFCHCYWQTDRRLIDLTPTQFESLGVPLASGLADVLITPIEQEIGLPDTAMAQNGQKPSNTLGNAGICRETP